jgi:hypothetical protein
MDEKENVVTEEQQVEAAPKEEAPKEEKKENKKGKEKFLRVFDSLVVYAGAFTLLSLVFYLLIAWLTVVDGKDAMQVFTVIFLFLQIFALAGYVVLYSVDTFGHTKGNALFWTRFGLIAGVLVLQAILWIFSLTSGYAPTVLRGFSDIGVVLGGIATLALVEIKQRLK